MIPDALRNWIDKRIDQMLHRPEMWAASTESLEQQIITLLEIRGWTGVENIDNNKVFDSYKHFSMQVCPSKPGPWPLSQVYGFGELVAALILFVNNERSMPQIKDV